MKKKHLKFLVTFFLLLCFSIIAYGQNVAKDTMSLVDYLAILEKEHDIKFSFADNALKEVSIVPLQLPSLPLKLDHIQKNTGMVITKLNDRYYTLTRISTVSICGFVFDNFEKNTIPGATVEILGTSISGITDNTGKFYFNDIPVSATVRVKHLGFKPQFLEVDKLSNTTACPIIAMPLSYQELEEVVVSQFLTTGLNKMSNASFELNLSKFGILPGNSEPDILQTVQALPGIKSVDETVSDINIRGGTNDQNLILWDHIKMYQTGHFFGLISAFNPYVTDKVTIIKNGTSSIYGDGLSGTLDLRTSDQIPAYTNGGAGFNLISGDVFGHIPINERLGLQFSGRRSYTDFLSTPTYTVFSEKAFQDSQVDNESDFYFYDFTAKLLFEINQDHKFKTSLITMSNNLSYFETNDNNTLNGSNLNQDNIAIGTQLESTWSNSFSTDVQFYYSQYGLNALTISNNESQTLKQNNLVKESNVKLITKYGLFRNLDWVNGYELTETGIENRTNINQPPFASNIKGVIRKHALFSEIKFTSEDSRFHGLLGARLNYIENLNTFKTYILEPRLNISYEVFSNFNAEVMGEFKSQVTNQIIDLEQNFLGIEKRRWILSDDDLLPITKSKQGSLGFNYDSNTLYVGIDGFYKEVNGINVYTQGFQNQNQFDGEIGSYVIKGAEFLINTKNNDYSAWLSYTFNKNDYTFNALTPTTFPNNLDVRHSVTLAGNYTLGNLKLGLGLNFRSGKPFTKPDANDPVDETVFPAEVNYEDPNSSRLPEYIRADASANYTFNLSKTIKGSFGASILNITNRRNTLNMFYRLGEDNTVETIERLSLGLTPNASFRIRF
ncbi:TonB-dependent receptor [Maribacter sp. LLG6340-A2]|uniref:TonB-dependent receptor n=1 Tax=Maribacter sp. LLG6340-A2 TaxID=3160834 RepID=UPI003865A159